MMPKGGLEPPRVAPYAPQTYVSTNSTTSAKGGFSAFKLAAYFVAGEAEGDGEAVAFPSLLSGDEAGLTAGEAPGLALDAGEAAGEATGLTAGIGGAAAAPSRMTELTPKPGTEKSNANTIKMAARIPVAFSRGFCGPRGPKADWLPPPPNAPEASPPLPDCNNTARIKKIQART